ncbi:hypothetical protein EYR40_003436 [Pleurotus pulmonarius]|nr:hypothetical protein EYR40_003436 [Pleurotus pulmonarius]KAF4606162.1 hypothetical protein EYR38_000208 [Pleurotus pulmonarius]
MAGFTQLALFCLACVLTGSSLVAALPSTKTREVMPDSAQELDVDVTATTDQVVFSHCTPDQQQKINDAIPVAQDWALESVTYLNNLDRNHTAAADERYKIWFGEYTQARFNEVIGRMAAVRTTHYDFWTYECTPDCGLLSPLTHAFVTPNRQSVVNLCPAFWRSDINERAATLIHEATHFAPWANQPGTNAFTWEFYGAHLARVLAHTSPDRAIVNAENYAFFARYRVGCEAPGGCSVM